MLAIGQAGLGLIKEMGFLRTSSLTQSFWVWAFGASQQPSHLSLEPRQHCTIPLHPWGLQPGAETALHPTTASLEFAAQRWWFISEIKTKRMQGELTSGTDVADNLFKFVLAFHCFYASDLYVSIA